MSPADPPRTPPALYRLFHCRDPFVQSHLAEWLLKDPPEPFESFLVRLVLELQKSREQLLDELTKRMTKAT